jgi:hypothetical protein
MNIVGEGINPIISGQIARRQLVYGSSQRTPEQLEFLNARTAFAKLVSGVDIDLDKFNPTSKELIGIKNKIGKDNLAKEFVLFNGTQKAGSSTDRGGISRDGSIINDAAYGLGGLEFGIRPMPGIISVDVKSENRGSLRRAEIKIKAWNRVQFEILDLLYLRVGYGVLLEWGNTIYFQNDNTFIRNRPLSLENSFLEGKYTETELLKQIQDFRINSEGNYDALYGKITNFSWTFAEDGSYDITLKLTSLGDVIESLKINMLVTDKLEITTNPGTPPGEGANETPTIESYKNKHTIGRTFYNISKILSKFTVEASGISRGYSGVGQTQSQTIDYIAQNYNEGDTQYYIRLGYFLDIIQNRIIPKYKKGTNIGKPIINIDTNYDNYIYTVPNQLSADPRICTISTKVLFGSGNEYWFAPGAESYTTEIGGTSVGQVMNIYVNFMYILSLMDSKLTQKNNVPLIDLLNSMLSDISKALGGINTLGTFIDEDINTIKIIDQTPLENKNNILSALNLTKPEDTVTLDIYGYYNRTTGKEAGFVRNFGLSSAITPDLSSILSISAQAAGSVVGTEGTALSALNKGLIDRTKPEITDADSTSGESQDKLADLNSKFKDANKDFAEFVKQLGSKNKETKPTWNSENVDSFLQLMTNFLTYNEAKKAIKASESPNSKGGSGIIGFIPISLNLTLDGISGIKIYNALRIDTAYLPSNYPTSMDFIITGLSHQIQSNVWTTDITTVMVAKDPTKGDGLEFASVNGSRPTSRTAPQPTPTSGNCRAEDVRLSPNYMLSQLSCNAPAAKYFVPRPGQPKTTARGTFTREQVIANLTAVAQNIVEPIRSAYPSVIVTNGYRNKGGNSQHEIGEAVDLQFSDIGGSLQNQNALILGRAQAIRRILEGKNGYDQFLLEYKTTRGGRPWIHISFRRDGANRNEVRTFLNDVTAKNGNGKLYNALA